MYWSEFGFTRNPPPNAGYASNIAAPIQISAAQASWWRETGAVTTFESDGAIAVVPSHVSRDGEGRGTASDKPDVVMQIDYLLDGQDYVTSGIVCWLDAADDAVKDQCTRIRAVADSAPEWDQYLVPQKRGR